jgi:hypothetical protein
MGHAAKQGENMLCNRRFLRRFTATSAITQGRRACLTIFCALLLLLPATAAFSEEMVLPSMPDLPSGEKDYDVGGILPNLPEKELGIESVSKAAEVQGEASSKNEEVKANKYRIDYGLKTSRIGGAIHGKDTRLKRDDKAKTDPQGWDQPVAAAPSIEKRLGSDYGLPQLGSIGFAPAERRSQKENKDTRETTVWRGPDSVPNFSAIRTEIESPSDSPSVLGVSKIH